MVEFNLQSLSLPRTGLTFGGSKPLPSDRMVGFSGMANSLLLTARGRCVVQGVYYE